MTDEARRPDDAGEAWPSEPSVPEEPPEPALPPAVALPPDVAIPFLEAGEIEIVGRLVQASNVTLLVAVHGDVPGRGRGRGRAVYKPIRGERPLWDFPDGTLAHREVGRVPRLAGERLGRRPADGLPGGRAGRARDAPAVGRGPRGRRRRRADPGRRPAPAPDRPVRRRRQQRRPQGRPPPRPAATGRSRASTTA